jgi:hypothetical protein
MADCKWFLNSDGHPQCSICGFIFPKPYDKPLSSLHRNCTSVSSSLPKSDGRLYNERKPGGCGGCLHKGDLI